jgi:hypothetical protein
MVAVTALLSAPVLALLMLMLLARIERHLDDAVPPDVLMSWQLQPSPSQQPAEPPRQG